MRLRNDFGWKSEDENIYFRFENKMFKATSKDEKKVINFFLLFFFCLCYKTVCFMKDSIMKFVWGRL